MEVVSFIFSSVWLDAKVERYVMNLSFSLQTLTLFRKGLIHVRVPEEFAPNWYLDVSAFLECLSIPNSPFQLSK
jgi:hypothetical protein